MIPMIALPASYGIYGSGPLPTATWDDTRQSGGITLDATKLIATRTSGTGNQIIVSTLGLTLGLTGFPILIWAEFLITKTGQSIYVGLFDDTGGSLLVTNASYRDDGIIFTNGVASTGFATYGTGDRINIAVTASEISYYKNGALITTKSKFSSSGTKIMCSMGVNGSSVRAVQQASMTYAPPSGYVSIFG